MGWLRRGRVGAGLGCLFVDEVMDDGASRAEPSRGIGLAAARVGLSLS